MRAQTVLPAALTVTVLLAGCGITDPYITRSTTTTSTSRPAPGVTGTTSTNADPAPEQGGTIPTPAASAQGNLSAGAGQPTPQAALGRYARLYTNWNAATVAGVQRQLASISLHGARAQALQAAASYQRDTTLVASKIANAGTVISIAAGQGHARGRWVIVTSETTTGHGDYMGLPATVHVTYAQVAHQPTGWVVTEWSPQT